MIKLLFFFFLLPLFCYPQNIITFASISKAVEETKAADDSEFEFYKIRISPGYQDHSYKIKIIQTDGAGKDTILDESVINVKLIIHRKNFKPENSDKIMWDYETEIKSNDVLKNEYVEVGDCSDSKNLNCFIRLNKTLKYKIHVYHKENSKFEFLIGF
jgi:hypothetical protein